MNAHTLAIAVAAIFALVRLAVLLISVLRPTNPKPSVRILTDKENLEFVVFQLALRQHQGHRLDYAQLEHAVNELEKVIAERDTEHPTLH